MIYPDDNWELDEWVNPIDQIPNRRAYCKLCWWSFRQVGPFDEYDNGTLFLEKQRHMFFAHRDWDGTEPNLTSLPVHLL